MINNNNNNNKNNNNNTVWPVSIPKLCILLLNRRNFVPFENISLKAFVSYKSFI